MRHYPILLNLEGRPCVVVGGGVVAFGKARTLHEAGARLTVVAPRVAREFDALQGIARHERPFQERDLDEAFLAVAATDDPRVNREVGQACRDRRILCNVVDAPELCDFIVPSALHRGDLTIAVSTGGASPALSKRLRHDLEALVPKDYDEYLRFLTHAREWAKGRVGERERRERMSADLASQAGYDRFHAASPGEREAWLDEWAEEPSSEGRQT